LDTGSSISTAAGDSGFDAVSQRDRLLGTNTSSPATAATATAAAATASPADDDDDDDDAEAASDAAVAVAADKFPASVVPLAPLVAAVLIVSLADIYLIVAEA
jgi:hypothetical protein